MSCLAIEPQKNSLSFRIGPPTSKPMSEICWLWSAVSGVTPRAAQLVGQVGRFEPVAGEVAARRAAQLVGAALDDEVEADAAGGLLDVVAAGRDLDFFERVVVEVGRRRTGGGHVGDRHAVHRPHGVALAAALGDERRTAGRFRCRRC